MKNLWRKKTGRDAPEPLPMAQQPILPDADEQEDATKRPELLRQFVQFASDLLESFEINTFLKASLDFLIDLARAERGLIILFDEAGENLYEAARNLSREDLLHPEFEVSQTVINRVRLSGHALCLANALDDASLRNSPSVARLKILSIICLPLKREKNVIGVAYLDNCTVRGVFTDEIFNSVLGISEFLAIAAFRAVERKRLNNHVLALEKELRSKYQLEGMVGHHPKIIKVFKLVSQIADTDASVLIYGESGTGKELVARALHFNNRTRCKNMFIPVNCGAIPDTLLESEMFGYARGAFTGALQEKMGWFEMAEGGTIFLDEINDLPLPLQVKLLRILQTGEYSRIGSTELRRCSVRVVAASSKNLLEQVELHLFRKDLYYRLNVIEIELPPLRERQSDIPLLACHFLKLYGDKFGRKELQLSPDAEEILMAYTFPGNVRELENVIQRAVLLSTGQVLELQRLSESLTPRHQTADVHGPLQTLREVKKNVVQKFEKSYLENCLRKTNGNITKAAAIADINIKNFYSKMKSHHLDPHDFKPEK